MELLITAEQFEPLPQKYHTALKKFFFPFSGKNDPDFNKKKNHNNSCSN